MSPTGQTWTVTLGGETGSLCKDDVGLTLVLGERTVEIPWAARPTFAFPTSYSATLSQPGEQQVDIGFASTSEQREFRIAVGATPAETPSPERGRLPLTTLDAPPVGQPAADLGLVTAAVVISRNLFSDAGSELKSLVGGKLGGVEKALDRALEEAKDRLSAAARSVGADAVVGVRVSIASVDDKAEMIVMIGTAISTRATPASQ